MLYCLLVVINTLSFHKGISIELRSLQIKVLFVSLPQLLFAIHSTMSSIYIHSIVPQQYLIMVYTCECLTADYQASV